MKIRNGFVTNSSSTSFICEVSGCDRSYEGYDWDIGYNWFRCKHGHWFCRSHINEEVAYLLEHFDEELNVPVRICPVCKEIRKNAKDALAEYKEGLKNED